MIDRAPVPADLRPLFPDAVVQAALSTPLPPGRLIVAAGGDGHGGDAPVMWLSDGPAPAGLWEELQREHPRSGLWPLLLTRRAGDPEFRPWATGELHPVRADLLDSHDPAALLQGWWTFEAEFPVDDPEEAEDRRRILEPFGVDWPGLAPAPRSAEDDPEDGNPEDGDPDAAAAAVARWLLRHDPGLRIGLVRAGSGAEALAACGWTAAGNHDPGELAAVLRSWERRFGARVVEVGPDGLRLSATAQPDDLDEALPIAAEHLAFCPDNVFQGTESLVDYAQELLLENCWSFWWD
ncbi:DUF4253 domain-containing protein [Kitasatospora sp. NPDC085464]|uniref:DUF4253 domain-containing protein n=1 Tax=Kitasatospora sp. NPDC085464 TaxID=3364063 RepID=UPI0037C85FB4